MVVSLFWCCCIIRNSPSLRARPKYLQFWRSELNLVGLAECLVSRLREVASTSTTQEKETFYEQHFQISYLTFTADIYKFYYCLIVLSLPHEQRHRPASFIETPATSPLLLSPSNGNLKTPNNYHVFAQLHHPPTPCARFPRIS